MPSRLDAPTRRRLVTWASDRARRRAELRARGRLEGVVAGLVVGALLGIGGGLWWGGHKESFDRAGVTVQAEKVTSNPGNPGPGAP